MIARAAEGSVRDALSIFDQAIAHGAGTVTAEQVRAMLGLADRARIVDLFEHVMKGDAAAALTEFRAQYDAGADPGGRAHRSCRVQPSGDAAALRAVGRRRCRPVRRRAPARRGVRREAVDAGAVAHLADAAQGHSRGADLEPAGQRRRNGADPARPRRRPADAGRGAEVAGDAPQSARSHRARPHGSPASDGRRRMRAGRLATACRWAAAAARPCGWSRPQPAARGSLAPPAPVVEQTAPACRSSAGGHRRPRRRQPRQAVQGRS